MSQPRKRKAVLGLHASDTAPRCQPAPDAHLDNHRARERTQPTLLTLPVEIRLRIYDLLLVSRSAGTPNNSYTIENSDQLYVDLDKLYLPGEPPAKYIESRILRACRKIYQEGNLILYSQNFFRVEIEDSLSRFCGQIGPDNTRLVTSVIAVVSYFEDDATWLECFTFLAHQTSGLRFLEVGCMGEDGWPEGSEADDLGAGYSINMEFLRALGRIQSLMRFTVRGFFAKFWQDSLQKELKMQVHIKD